MALDTPVREYGEAATALAIAASTADASGRSVAVRDARRIGASSVG